MTKDTANVTFIQKLQIQKPRGFLRWGRQTKRFNTMYDSAQHRKFFNLHPVNLKHCCKKG